MGDPESVDIYELFPLLPSRVTIGDIRQAILNHEYTNEKQFSWNIRVEKQLVPDLLREILNVADGRLARQKQGGSGYTSIHGNSDSVSQRLTGAGDPNSTTARLGAGSQADSYVGGRGGVVEQI